MLVAIGARTLRVTFDPRLAGKNKTCRALFPLSWRKTGTTRGRQCGGLKVLSRWRRDGDGADCQSEGVAGWENDGAEAELILAKVELLDEVEPIYEVHRADI